MPSRGSLVLMAWGGRAALIPPNQCMRICGSIGRMSPRVGRRGRRASVGCQSANVVPRTQGMPSSAPPSPPLVVVTAVAAAMHRPVQLVIGIVGIDAAVVELAVGFPAHQPVCRVNDDRELRLRRAVLHHPLEVGVDPAATGAVLLILATGLATGAAAKVKLRLCRVCGVDLGGGNATVVCLLHFLQLGRLPFADLQRPVRACN